MKLIGIAVVGTNHVIGDGQHQPFTFREDWARFKRVTSGHPLIVGRRTHDSMGLLPGRTSIVVTRTPEAVVAPEHVPAGSGLIVVTSLSDAFARAADLDEEIYVAGGGEIYRQAWRYLTDLDITEVHAAADGSVLLPAIDPATWLEVRREPRGEFDFVGYVRRDEPRPISSAR